MENQLTRYNLRRIAGGQTEFPQPFMPDWGWYIPLPFSAILFQWGTVPPSYMDPLLVYATALLPQFAPAIAAYSIAYHLYREFFELDPEQDEPEDVIPSNPTPLEPIDTPSPWSGGNIGIPGAAVDVFVSWDCHKAVRAIDSQESSVALSRLLTAQLDCSRLLVGGTVGYTVVATTALNDQETEVEGQCDGAVVHLTSVPSKYGSIFFDGVPWVYPRLGMLSFGYEGIWDERQKVELSTAVYAPRNLAQANIVRVRTKPGVFGTLTSFTIGALC